MEKVDQVEMKRLIGSGIQTSRSVIFFPIDYDSLL